MTLLINPEKNFEYDFSNLRRNVDYNDTVFDMKKIFIPINIRNTHWVLAVVYVNEKRICYYDSLISEDKTYRDLYFHSILRWLHDVALLKSYHFNQNDWELEEQTNIPQQHNSFDCGMFVLAYCVFIAKDLDLHSFSQNDMPSFRTSFENHIRQGYIG